MENIVTTTCATVFVVLVLVLTLNWKKWRLFYYSLQFPGPKSIPFIGISFKLLLAINKDLYGTIMQIFESQPHVFKVWIASDLYIANSQPADLEILLNTFFDKSLIIYEFLNYFTGVNILTSPASIWKGRRKEMNRTFKPKTIASFHDTFVKYADNLVMKFDESCGEDQPDLIPEIWKCTLDSAIETLFDIEPNAWKDRYEFISSTVRSEEIVMVRFQKCWLMVDFFFRFSHLQNEAKSVVKQGQDFGEKIISIKRAQTEDDLNLEYFLNYMMDLSDEGKNITEQEVKQELLIMLGEASETTALSLNSVIILLGLYPEVQNKLYEEILSSSLDNTHGLDYLERVIKEAMRLFPVVPFILRSIDKDIKLGSLLYPEGSNLIIPIAHIHQRPDLWPDPLKFDPDRFLPEEVAKRHRCAYMPFSFGQRNCIGLKYAMLSMKVTLASIVKNFKIRAVNYRSLEDLEIDWHLVARVKGCVVKFEKRTI